MVEPESIEMKNLAADPNQNNLAGALGLLQYEKMEDGTKKTSFYFDLALGISFTLCLIMAILLGLTILDLDKCESTYSPNCPYFTNPDPDATADAKPLNFQTKVGSKEFALLPDPYNT